MSVGLRDRRIRIYGYTSVEDEGVSQSLYVYRETRWGRRASPTGREATVGLQASHVVDAVFVFHDEATLDPDDMLIDGDERFLVRAILPRRMLREIQVYAQSTDDEGSLLDLDVS